MFAVGHCLDLLCLSVCLSVLILVLDNTHSGGPRGVLSCTGKRGEDVLHLTPCSLSLLHSLLSSPTLPPRLFPPFLHCDPDLNPSISLLTKPTFSTLLLLGAALVIVVVIVRVPAK